MQSFLERYRALRIESAVNGNIKVVSNVESEIVPVDSLKEYKSEDTERLLSEALKVFGYDSFRDGQEEVIREVLGGKDGVLAVFPTGAGKSLVYQIIPLITNKLVVVVSPLISLMRDQVVKLQKLGINAVFINSTVPMNDVKVALLEVRAGGVKLIYVAPERFSNPEFIKAMDGIEVDVLAIDEAHCISRWGNDFRPAYAELGGAIEKLKPRQVAALTATATEKVREDILRVLNLEKSKRFVQSVWRKNLRFRIYDGRSDRYGEMARLVKGFVDKGHKTGIIYCPTRKEAEMIDERFKVLGIKSDYYHAGLPEKTRSQVQDAWAKDGGVIVATCAFGMGIDRPDVRFVIHSGLTQSVEDIFQQVGRAGRDGETSYCISYWDMGDYRTQKFLIGLTHPSAEDVDKFWRWIKKEGERLAVSGNDLAEICLTQKDMSLLSGCINVGGCVSVLKGEGLVQTVGRGKYTVAFKKERVVTQTIEERARKDKFEQLERVIEFYRSRDCRFSYLCGYFGDHSFSGNCGVCDNCIR